MEMSKSKRNIKGTYQNLKIKKGGETESMKVYENQLLTIKKIC